jgi:iron complex outermembrane receptor protein
MRLTLLASALAVALCAPVAATAADSSPAVPSVGDATAAVAPQVQTRDRDADTKPVQDLKSVTVTAVPGGQNADRLVIPVAVLAGSQLDNAKGSTIGDTVSKIPGVQTTALGQAVGRPVIRGLGGPRVAVTENGLGSADVSNVSQDHAVTVEPFLADQIEVLKGPSTLLYGSGAIGGVVNVVDGRIPQQAPDGGFGGRAEARYDSVSDGHTGMFRLDGGNDTFAMHVDGLRRDDGNYDIPGGTLANSWLKTTSGAFGASLLGDWGYLGASVSRYMDDYGSPAEPGDPDEGEDPVHLKMAQTRYDVKGGFNHPLPGFSKLEINAGHTDYQHVEFEGDTPGTTFTNKTNEGRLVLTHEPLAGWLGAFGMQYFHRDFAAVGEETFVPPTSTRGLGAFLTEQRQWGPLQLELGARLDHQDSTPQNGARRSFRPKSFSAGLGWQLADAWRLTLNLDRAQRAPAEEELFANGPHEASATYEIGDPGLGVETANQAELGLHYGSALVDARIAVYDNDYSDFIYLADTGRVDDDLPVRIWSQHDARFRGAEAEATIHLAKGPGGHWALRVYGDAVRATLDGGGNLPRIPQARLGSELSWNLGNLRASVGGVRYFAQRRTAEFETPTDGFTLVNAHVGWTFHNGEQSQWEAFVDGTNLTGQTARLATSLFKDESPLPGRNVSVGVRAWF